MSAGSFIHTTLVRALITVYAEEEPGYFYLIRRYAAAGWFITKCLTLPQHDPGHGFYVVDGQAVRPSRF